MDHLENQRVGNFSKDFSLGCSLILPVIILEIGSLTNCPALTPPTNGRSRQLKLKAYLSWFSASGETPSQILFCKRLREELTPREAAAWGQAHERWLHVHCVVLLIVQQVTWVQGRMQRAGGTNGGKERCHASGSFSNESRRVLVLELFSSPDASDFCMPYFWVWAQEMALRSCGARPPPLAPPGSAPWDGGRTGQSGKG